MMSDATRLHQEGELQQAESLLRELLESAPRHTTARLLLARVLIDRRAWDAAAEILNDVPESTSGYTLFHLRGRVALMQSRIEAARRDISRALVHRPESAVDWFYLGEVHARAGRSALAIDAYRKAQASGYTNAQLHVGLARAYHERGTDSGRTFVRRLDGDKVGSLLPEGYVFEAVTDSASQFRLCPPASAVFQIATARRRGADGADIDLLEADVLSTLGRYDRAAELYRRAERNMPQPPDGSFHARLGKALWEIGDLDSALRSLKRAADLDPDRYRSRLAEAHLAAADRLTPAPNARRMLYHLEEALRAQPTDAQLHCRLADAYAESNRMESAVHHWYQALRLAPDRVDRSALLERIHAATKQGR